MNTCEIVEVGKRRDGGYRYWCTRHGANATAKYGVAAEYCVAANDEPIGEDQTLRLIPSEFAGGIALWGAVPPVYDTTFYPLDRGIHVHARREVGAKKVVDETFRRVMLPIKADLFSDDWAVIDELDAINFMVSKVYGFSPKSIVCPNCNTSHLDRDWFAVHTHKRHLCHGCGRNFSDREIAIGNPVSLLQHAFSSAPNLSSPAVHEIEIHQSDFPGGIQIWGSNPAIIWTSPLEEKEGIHLHAYADAPDPVIDGTFAAVIVDGVRLEADQVRLYMAQQSMPHIAPRVSEVACKDCGRLQFDVGANSFTPRSSHRCTDCGSECRAASKFRNVIANPIVAHRKTLSLNAVNPLREDKLDLRSEAI